MKFEQADGIVDANDLGILGFLVGRQRAEGALLCEFYCWRRQENPLRKGDVGPRDAQHPAALIKMGC